MDEIEFGARLKQFREQRGLTLKQVAALSGLSIGFISQVERNQTDPSLASLKKIAAALGIKLKQIFEQEDLPHSVVKKGRGSMMVIHKVNCEMLATVENKTMEPVLKYIEPQSESGIVDPHPGEEFVWVKSGSLCIYIGGSECRLSEGDSLYFLANQTHYWTNDSSDTPCEALWIISPPIYT